MFNFNGCLCCDLVSTDVINIFKYEILGLSIQVCNVVFWV